MPVTDLFFLLILTFSFVSSGLSVKLFQGPRLFQNVPIRLPFAKRINQTSIKNVLKIDRASARAAAHMARFGMRTSAPVSRRDTIDEPVDDQAVSYVASVGIGSPATQCQFHFHLVAFCMES